MELISTDSYSVIVGGGATGLSVARYLLNNGERFMVFDTRNAPAIADAFHALDQSIRVYLAEIDAEVLLGAKEIILSPGVAKKSTFLQAAIRAGIPIIGDVALFLRAANAPVIGITGSNGKTTVTTVMGMAAVAAGIRSAVGGNIGTPALDLLASDVELYILELSSFQLETMHNPGLKVAAVLNVSVDHMDRYDSFAEYCMTKQRIFWQAQNVVYNLQDTLTIPPKVSGVKRFGFSLTQQQEKNETQFIYDAVKQSIARDGKIINDKQNISIDGLHNIQNAMAVYAIAEAAGIDRAAVSRTLLKFSGLPHRCEHIVSIAGIDFVNDSKATNVGATVSAVQGLAGDYTRRILIAGGDGKGANFDELAQVVIGSIERVVVFGADAQKIVDAILTSAGPNACDVRIVKTLADAVTDAYDYCLSQCYEGHRRALILLSPACASLDMYKNYEARGNEFRALAQNIAKTKVQP